MKVKVSINTRFAGCKHEDVLSLPDDYTEEEINEDVLSWVHDKKEIL